MIAEFGMDAYPEIGIVRTEIVEVVDRTADALCEEGETWRTVIREHLVIDVEPEERRASRQICAGHEIEVAREDKGLVWFHNKSTADDLAAETRRRMGEDRNVKESLVRTVKKNGLYGVEATYSHHDDAAVCSRCQYHSAERAAGWEERRVYRCPGHWLQLGGRNIYSDGDSADKRRQKTKAKLAEIRKGYKAAYGASEFYLHQHPHEDAEDFDIHGWYRHQDSETKPCDSAGLVLSYVKPEKRTERWEADEAVPPCPCIREIVGLNKRVRVFECAKVSGSKCEECRRQGGTLIRKECIGKAMDGRCVKWKKVYDMKQFASYTKRIHHFEDGESVYGFNGEYDDRTRVDNKSDFAETFAALLGAVPTPGSVVETRNELPDERCHFVGLRMDGEDDVKFVYCCFADKIARLVQEGAKEGWGTAAFPDCSASQPSDFETLDLTEAHDSILDRDMIDKIQKQMAGR